MMDLIDRAALRERCPIRIDNYDEVHGSREFVLGIETVFELIEAMPTIHAVPVVECEWERMKDERDILCSVCKARFNPDIRFLTDSQIRYCPHCGAKVVKVRWT